MPKVKLGDIAKERREVYKGNKFSCPVVGLEHLTPGEIRLSAWDVGGDNTFSKAFFAGDVLFGRRRAYLKKAAQATVDGLCSGDITVIQASPDQVSPDLLPFIIQNDAFFEFAVENSAGSLSPRVKWEHLANFEIDLPSMDEQRKLASLLWAAYELKESYERLLRASDEMAKSRFNEMFGEPGTDQNGWGITTLGKCCELNPHRPKDLRTDVSYSFVAMPSVDNEGHVDASIERPYSEICKGFTYFAENDVLFAKITPCMENGKGGIAQGLKNRVGFGSTEFHVLRPINGVSDPHWLYTITMLQKFRIEAEKVMTGTGGQRRVPINYLDEYRIALPPFSLQKRFASFVQQLDKSKVELQKSIASTSAMIKSLLSEAMGE